MNDIKVLIVDDIVVNRILIKEIIKKITTNYVEASNGKQAVDLLIEHDDFDVVLMDIEMPVMNGIEATKYIREKLPHPKNKIPVLALTAHNPAQFFNDYKDVGFDELMTKPFSLEKVQNLIIQYGTK